MSKKARVTASHDIEPMEMHSVGNGLDHTTPEVHIEVSFDLHDHESALRDLDVAVANIKVQIGETA